jgi:hypothetical protein
MVRSFCWYCLLCPVFACCCTAVALVSRQALDTMDVLCCRSQIHGSVELDGHPSSPYIGEDDMSTVTLPPPDKDKIVALIKAINDMPALKDAVVRYRSSAHTYAARRMTTHVSHGTTPSISFFCRRIRSSRRTTCQGCLRFSTRPRQLRTRPRSTSCSQRLRSSRC